MAYKTGSVTPTSHVRWAKMRSRAQRQAGLSRKSSCHSEGLASFDSTPQMSDQRRQIGAWLTDNNRPEQDKVQRSTFNLMSGVVDAWWYWTDEQTGVALQHWLGKMKMLR